MQVNNSVKLSYKIARGSFIKRQKIVSDMNEKFFDEFHKLFKEKNLTIEDINEVYANLLPEWKRIKILALKNTKNADGASDYIYNGFNSIVGLTLEIPLKKSKIKEDSFVTLMHENTHILDTLLNPKYTALVQDLRYRNKYNKKRNYWYEKTLYCEEKVKNLAQLKKVLKNVKIKTKIFLKQQSTYDKILYLQDARYQLESEKIAFDEQLKYAKKIKLAGMPVIKSDLKNWNKSFLFTEKINLLKKMIADLIKKEREKIHKANLKNKA